MSAPIFLMSDFGLRDAFVGVMRAVIAGLSPASPVHDLVHELPPQDLAAARLQLAAALPWLPGGAVLCAVVDPGVGSDRRAVAVRARMNDGAAGRTLWAVVPDNGLLTPLLDRATIDAAFELDRDALPPAGPGTTFDGRDLFAPAAARVAAGADGAELGAPIDGETLVRTEDARPQRTPAGWRGEVVWVDRFGNLVTNLEPAHLPAGRFLAEVAGRRVAGPSRAFADVARGEAVAYLGSLGRLELALREADAATAWGARVGTEVRLRAAD